MGPDQANHMRELVTSAASLLSCAGDTTQEAIGAGFDALYLATYFGLSYIVLSMASTVVNRMVVAYAETRQSR
jgi:hypothetical protein